MPWITATFYRILQKKYINIHQKFTAEETHMYLLWPQFNIGNKWPDFDTLMLKFVAKHQSITSKDLQWNNTY